MGFRTLDDIGDVHGKRVLVREDLNVPMADGVVTDDTRFRATISTVTELTDKGAVVLILAHLGRRLFCMPTGRGYSTIAIVCQSWLQAESKLKIRTATSITGYFWKN